MPSRATLANYLRHTASDYAKSFLGERIPYSWGGQDTLEGFDCSGFVVNILQSVGIFPLNKDITADGLYKKYKKYSTEYGYIGCLVFWTKDQRAFHVEFMIDRMHIVGASGGGRPSWDLAEAIRKDKVLSKFYVAPSRDELRTLVKESPILWAITKLLELKDAMDRDAFIKQRNLYSVGGNFTIADPFQEVINNERLCKALSRAYPDR